MDELVRAKPLYAQVADALRRAIDEGEYTPGTLLPSAGALQQRYKVSPPVIRQALEILRSEGRIRTVNGRGSYVRNDNVAVQTAVRTIQTAQALSLKGEPHRHRAPAGTQLADLLGIPADEPTFVAVNAYTDEQTGDPVLYSSILPFSVAEGTPLEEVPFPERPELLATLTDAYGEPEWWEYVRARMPQPDETTALNIPDGTPILETIRILRNGDRPTLAEVERRSGAAVQHGYRLVGAKTETD